MSYEIKFTLLFNILEDIYATFLRDLLKNEINNPESDLDEVILKITDSIFNYK